MNVAPPPCPRFGDAAPARPTPAGTGVRLQCVLILILASVALLPARVHAQRVAINASGAAPAAFAGQPPVALDYMDDLSSWIVSGQHADVTLETSPQHVRHGAASIRMRTAAVAGDQSRILKRGLNVNLAAAPGLPDGRRLNVWLYAPTLNPAVGTQSVTLVLGSDASGFANYYSTVLSALEQGWNRLPLHAADFTVVGTPSWASIRQIRFTMNSAANRAMDLTIDFLETQAAIPPTVLLAFDDGNESGYDHGFLPARSRGLPLTFYVIAQNLDTPGRLTSAEVDEMYAAGSDIALHDAGDWDAGTADEIYALIKAQYDVVAPRWPRAALHLAWPHGRYGQYNDNVADVMTALDRLGIVTGRSVGKRRIQAYGGEFDEPRALGVGRLLDARVTLSQVQQVVQQAIATRTTVFIVAHKLAATPGNDQWAISDYTALLDFLAARRDAGQLTIDTISNWYRRTTTPVASGARSDGLR